MTSSPSSTQRGPHTNRLKESGASVLLVLWALMLLSAAILSWAQWIQHDIQLSGEASHDMEARAMAHSGLAMALHPLVTLQSPQLERQFDSERSYSVRLISEGGKLNINWLLQGEDLRKITLLKQWLEQLGLTFQDREMFVDCLLDYVDGDNVKRMNGVEDEEGYFPANRPLQSVDEITEVYSSELLTSVPGWKDYLTIHSAGPVDLLAAEPEILSLLPGIGDTRVQQFIKIRRGTDGIDGTADDFQFKNLEEIRSVIGMTQSQWKELGGLIGTKDPHMRIISQGRVAEIVRQVEVIARKGGANPAIVFWKE